MRADHKSAGVSDGSRCYAGFTLIELLVVVAIISLLFSILLPSLKRAKELAKSTVCMNNLKQSGNAYIMYALDNDNDQIIWFNNCGWYDLVVKNNFGIGEQAVRCPDWYWEETSGKNYYYTYGTGWFYLSCEEHVPDPPGIETGGRVRHVDEIHSPSNSLMLADSNMPVDGDPSGGRQISVIYKETYSGWQNKLAHFRHTERCNVAFQDGHVSSLTPEEYVDGPLNSYSSPQVYMGLDMTPMDVE